MMQDALRWGYVHRNAVALAKPPKVERIEMTVLTAAQVQSLLEFSDATPLRSLWRLAIGTALRAGELLALRWQDVDLDAKEFTVNHTLQDRRGGIWELTEPKSAKSRRKISLTDSLVEELLSHRVRQNEQMLAMGKHYKDRGSVFAREDGRPFVVSSLKRRHLEPILRQAGLPVETRVHDLRHTSISHALANGAPIADVSQWAGHANVSITLSLYAHAMPEATKRTTEAVASALGI
jgi:integrase